MGAPPIVAVIDHRFDDLEIEREVLSQVGAQVVDLAGATLEESLTVAASADGILLGPRVHLGRAEIDRLVNCRVIARYGVGVDNVDVRAAQARGITVTTVPDYCVEEVANHAFALLLALHRNLGEFDHGMRSRTGRPSKAIPRLSSCTLGLVGFGRIGRQVAIRGKAFGMTVLVHDLLVPESEIRSLGAIAATKEEVISEVDFLSLHVPLTDMTRHFLNETTLATMRDGVIIVNVSRGGLIDEGALADRIESGHLGGAGLDVSEVEPLPEGDRLLSLPRVVLTPHIAWMSTEAVIALRRGAAEEALIVLRGDSPRHPVTPD